GLPDVEEPEQDEGGDQDGDGARQRQGREEHPGHLVDDDDPGVLGPDYPLHTRRRPDAEHRDDDERPEQAPGDERDEPERDQRDEAADGSGGDGSEPGAADAGDDEGQPVDAIEALTRRPARSRPPPRWRPP